MKKILLLTFNELIASNGISKKIEYQKKALESQNNNVRLMYVEIKKQHISICIDKEDIFKCRKNIFWALKVISLKPVLNYVEKNEIKYLYVRYTQFASPTICLFFKSLKQMGVKIALEIPSYPYDNEYKTFRQKIFLQWERFWRRIMANYIDFIITFSQYDNIWKKSTIRIKNGIDFSKIPLRVNNRIILNKMEIIAVAGLSFWHGFDRIIEGLNIYINNNHQQNVKVHLNIVGIGQLSVLNSLIDLVKKYNLDEYVTFCGEKFGKELDNLFASADLAIGCLGCHRKKIKEISSLKNVEYAARGIPFIYSEINKDFDNMPYVKKEKPDDSPINILDLVNWRRKVNIQPREIRETIIDNLSWEKQMEIVLSHFY